MPPNKPHILRLHFDGLGTPTVTATVEGIAGPGCTQASAWLDRIGTVKLDLHTDDFFEDEDLDNEVDRERELA